MIKFSKPYQTKNEFGYISQALKSGNLSGDNGFTKKCHRWLEENTMSPKVLLTPSCTAALEMAAILIDIKEGDEVIMPSYTFVSTANAFLLRGATPVFVDIRKDTLNINEKLIESAITSKTKAIVPVHYAGVACEMDEIMAVAKKYSLYVIEDAAQGVLSYYKGKALGSIGDLGTYSFHETKNITCGEGGALLINNPSFLERAEVVREKGTNRSLFVNGKIEKYTWIDIGSSYLPSDVTAAYLYSQLEEASHITKLRLEAWDFYQENLIVLERHGFERPSISISAQHNAHIYYVICPKDLDRSQLISTAMQNGIQLTSHYIPLHSSPAGLKNSKTTQELITTNDIAKRIIRLPLWPNIDYKKVANSIITSFSL